MDLKEKRQERKQRKEAKAYFNANNEYKMNGKKWFLIILIGIVVSTLGTILIETIAGSMGFRIGFLYLGLGYCVASAIIYITKTGNTSIGVVAAVTFAFGLLLGMVIYNLLSLYQFGLSTAYILTVDSIKQILNYIIQSLTKSPISTIMYFMGAGVAYGVGSR